MVIIQAKIKPNAKFFKVIFIDNDKISKYSNQIIQPSLLIEVPETPENNQANICIVKEFSKIGIYIKILRGMNSRKKLIEFCNLTLEELTNKLKSLNYD